MFVYIYINDYETMYNNDITTIKTLKVVSKKTYLSKEIFELRVAYSKSSL